MAWRSGGDGSASRSIIARIAKTASLTWFLSRVVRAIGSARPDENARNGHTSDWARRAAAPTAPVTQTLSGDRSRAASSGDSGTWPIIDRALLPLGAPAGEVLPALDDDVDVERIDFHEEGVAAGLFGGD